MHQSEGEGPSGEIHNLNKRKEFIMNLKRVFTLFCISVLTLLLTGLVPAGVQADEITLTWLSFVPKNSPEAARFQKYYVDVVNQKARGELVIKYRGGPEIMQLPDIGPGVQKGIVDIATTILGFYESVVPGIGAYMLSELSPEETRKPGGAYDYMVELHKKKGLMFLGRSAPKTNNFFYFFLNKKIEKPEDFKTTRLGSGTAMLAAAKAWGASVTPLKLSDYYTAMERNLVDGVPSCPIDTWVALGCTEVTKYVLDHQFYQTTGVAIMNLKKWEMLPAHLQKMMMDTMMEYQKVATAAGDELEKKMRKKMMDEGVEFYKLAPKDAEWLMTTAYNAAWENQRKRFPEETATLEKLLRK
jgi:TRAP-type C4-dicarboxylate transport system substrate-binding protein